MACTKCIAIACMLAVAVGQASQCPGWGGECLSDDTSTNAVLLLQSNLQMNARKDGGEVSASHAADSDLSSTQILYTLGRTPTFPDRLLKASSKPPELTELCVAGPVGGRALAQDSSFQSQVQKGIQAAASKGILLAGLVHNIHASVPHLLATLRKVGQTFARYHIILLENGSTDDTKKDLTDECKDSDDTWCFSLELLQIGTTGGQRSADRVKKLVGLRQVLLEQVRRLVSLSPDKSVWDFLMYVDGDMFDEGSLGFHPSMVHALFGFQAGSAKPSESAASSMSPMPPKFETNEIKNQWHGPTLAEAPWDVVCANQLTNLPEPGRYRDSFALRFTSWEQTAGEKASIEQHLHYSGNKLVQIKSCFSGLALYSMKSITTSGCNYTFQDESTCEHVTFHKCMADSGHGTIGIFPPLTNIVNDGGVCDSTCAPFGEK